MKKEEKTNVMTSEFDKVFVSAGKVGFQIELAPDDLISVAGCQLADMYQDYIDGKKELKDINQVFAPVAGDHCEGDSVSRPRFSCR